MDAVPSDRDSRKHSNIQLLTQRPNQGKPAALNKGFETATHDIVVTIDADTQLNSDAPLSEWSMRCTVQM